MTKAELLKRFRWLFILLPFATAAGFRLMLFLLRQTEIGALTVPSPVYIAMSLFYHFAEVVVMSWLLLTLVCSTRIAYTIAAGPEGNIRGTLGIVLLFVLTWGLIGAHVAVSALVFLPSLD